MNKNQNIQKIPLPCGGGLGVGKTQNIKQGYRQSEIGILPQDWEVVRLGEVCEFLKTYQNARSDLNDNDEINYIHYGEIHTKYEHFIDFAKAKLPKINAKKLAKELQSITFCQNGDLVVVDASEDYTAIAKSVEIQNLDSRAVAGLHTFLLRDKANFFANGFKGYMLYNSEVYSELKRLATGISVLSVSKTNLSNLQIPLPPLKEQEKIARILGAWDNAIATLDSLIKAKQRYKKALMQRLLTPPCESKTDKSPLPCGGDLGVGKIAQDKTKAVLDSFDMTHPLAPSAREGEIENGDSAREGESLDCHESTTFDKIADFRNGESLRFGGFSDKWQEFRLGDICIYENGGAFEKYVSENGNLKLITLDSISLQGKLKDSHKLISLNTQNTLCQGDIVMILSDIAHGNFLGLTGIIPNNNEYVLNQRVGLLRIKNDNIDSLFLSLFINLNQKYFKQKGQGSSQQNLSKKDIEQFKVFLPTLAEQKKIAQVLSVCDKEIAILDSKLQCLKTQKRGLMQQLLSGNVRVKC